MGKIKEALAQLYQRHWDNKKNSVIPELYYEDGAELESVCYIGKPVSGNLACWQPVEMKCMPDFKELESILGINLHSDLKEFYGSYWAGALEGLKYDEEVLSLNGILNQYELARALTNIIGHVQARRGEFGEEIEDSVVIANTDSDYFFSINNKTGEVLLEEAGYPPLQVVASSLEQFLNELE